MRPRRPYLLRALYEWMADSGHTPHILVDARQEGVEVPAHAVHEGRIVLNVSAQATQRLALGNERVEFDARFDGVARHVVVPVRAVLAIYARETGQGMMFGLEDETAPLTDGDGTDGGKPAPKGSGRPALKVVK